MANRKVLNPQPGALLRVAVYIRVSTDAQAKKGDSTDEQLETCTTYIDNNENMVLQGVYIDDGISGQKLKRGDFSRLIQNVRAGEVDFIIFTKLDRWFRNLRHYLNTQDILEKYGVNWLAVSQPYYDTSTPQGRAFIAQSMTFAELEAQNDSERILSVFDYKYRHGEVLSGKTPLGYSIVEKHLQLNDAAPVALDIFEYYSRTGSLNATISYLENRYGIVMSQANLKSAILKNKKYIGAFRDNLEYCPAIVPRDLFDDVQRKLSINVKSSQKYSYVFAGLLKCRCGHAYTGAMQSTRRGDRVYKYPIYRCTAAYPNKRCSNRKTVNEHTLERYLLDNIKPLLSEQIAEYEIAASPAVDNAQRRATLLKKIDKLKELFVNDLITLEEFKTDKAEYMRQISELRDDVPVKDLSELRSFMKLDIESIYGTMTNEEKRFLWRSVIREIVADENHNYTVSFL